MQTSPNSVIRFERFSLDPGQASLRKDGEPIKLQVQPFRALVYLASRPGQLVTRAELRDAIWSDGTVVDFEHGLNTCIRQIRTALGDDARSARIIETVPKVGYRFVAAVHSENPSPERIRLRSTVPLVGLSACVLGALVVVLSARPTNPRPEAVALYERGVAAEETRTTAGYQTARQLFERAAALDAQFAKPHAALARLYVGIPSSLPGLRPSEGSRLAEVEANRALALDPREADFHAALAQVKLVRGDGPGAGVEYQAAIRLDPRSEATYEDYGFWLAEQARFDEALVQTALAETIDPLSPRARWATAVVLRWARRYDESIAAAQKGLTLNPTYGPLHHELGVCYEAKRDFDRAIDEFRMSGQKSGNLGHAYAVAGREAEARALLATFEARWAASHVGAGEIAQIYVGLGDVDRAFEWLLKTDGPALLTIRVASVWDPLRSDSRFAQVLARSPFHQ